MRLVLWIIVLVMAPVSAQQPFSDFMVYSESGPDMAPTCSWI